jgi:hypothetical protein
MQREEEEQNTRTPPEGEHTHTVSHARATAETHTHTHTHTQAFQAFAGKQDALLTQLNLNKEACILKIRLLSLCTLGARQETIAYKDIAACLQVPETQTKQSHCAACGTWELSGVGVWARDVSRWR